MAMLCDQCPHADVFSLEEWSSSRSCLHECGFCPSLDKLDAEILKLHNMLIELSKQRKELKIKISRYHKPPINRLPFELISQIFIDVNKKKPYELEFHRDYSAPVRLGGVCKMWRNITLGTPQLWTSVSMNFKACKSPFEIDVAREWLSRSRSLPLSLNIDLVDCSGLCVPRGTISCFYSPINLIRSHSSRWSRVNLESSNANLLHNLLNNLKDRPTDLEYLSVGQCRRVPYRMFNKSAILLPRSISQAGSRLHSVGLWDLPCGFERVTHMEMEDVPVDEICYFFKNASNLQKCTVSFDDEVMDDDEEPMFSLPTTPIVAQSLTVLEARFSSAPSPFFGHLTLPSLRTLELGYHSFPRQSDVDNLVACLERSSPPLQNFTLDIYIGSPEVDGWYKLLPGLTSVTVDMSDVYEFGVTEGFLAALARRSGPLVLPKLRSLYLTVSGMSSASWASLCDIFRAGSQEQAVSRNLLKEIEIRVKSGLERDFAIEARVFEFFGGLRNSGITLRVFFYEGPKFGSSA